MLLYYKSTVISKQSVTLPQKFFHAESYLWLNNNIQQDFPAWNQSKPMLWLANCTLSWLPTWMNPVCSKTTVILIWLHTDHSELMQPCVVKLNIYQCSVWACSASHWPRARLSRTLFLYLGFGNASLFMLWPSANRSILTAEAVRWQRSSSVQRGLTQLGPGNSSFPTTPPQKG